MANQDTIIIRDRRGEARVEADSPPREVPKAPIPSPAAPRGKPVRFTCGFCKADISAACTFMQVVLPQPDGAGNLVFTPQFVYQIPLLCPHCQEPQAYQQAVFAGRLPS